MHRRHRDVRVHRRPGREGPGGPTEIEAGARAVRVALLLPELPVQPGVEEAAQDRAHDGDGVVVRDQARRTRMADPDLRLDGAGPMDDPDPPVGRRRRRIDLPGRRRVRMGSPASEALGSRARGRPAPPGRRRRRASSAPGRTGGRARPATWPRPDAATVSAMPGRRPAVRRARRVDRGDERLFGAPARVRPRLQDVVEALVPEPLDLRRPGRSAGRGPPR